MAVLVSPYFWAAAFINVPGDDGKLITIDFRVRFHRLKASVREALEYRIEANKLTNEIRIGTRASLDDPETQYSDYFRKRMEGILAAKPITDAEFCKEVVVDLDIKDTEGNPIIYTPANMEELEEELDGFYRAIVLAYFKVKKAAANKQDVEKNSETQSGTTSS